MRHVYNEGEILQMSFRPTVGLIIRVTTSSNENDCIGKICGLSARKPCIFVVFSHYKAFTDKNMPLRCQRHTPMEE